MCQRDQWNIQIWQLQDFPLFVRGEPETNQMRRKPSPREFVQCHVYGLRLVDIKFYKTQIQIYSLFQSFQFTLPPTVVDVENGVVRMKELLFWTCS